MSAPPRQLAAAESSQVDWVPGFELRSEIGAGGYGTVFKAHQANLDRIVAVKLLRADITSNPVAAARFEAEAVVLARLRHPNIVQVIDAGHHRNRAFIAMELLEGEDLGSRLAREGPLPEKIAWAIARQVVAALAHAAAVGVVHRDIKPANIFLIPPPTGMNLPPGVPMVKVMDFGLALSHFAADPAEDRLTPTGTVIGTPIYMAPEQHAQAANVDHRADIYALGATIACGLLGKPPFRARTFSELIEQKRVWTPQRESKFTPASAGLLARMMAAKPDLRIGNYEELISEIDNLLQGVTGSRGTRLQVKNESSRRRRQRGAIAAAILLTFLLAIAAGAKFRPKRNLSVAAPVRLYERRGDDVTLYDKQSLDGWLPPVSGGNWNLESDDERDRVLAGIGFTRRLLPSADDYRVTIGLDIHSAAAAEVHFALPADSPERGKRLVLRVSRNEGAAVGTRDGDKGPFQQVGAPRAFPPAAWFEGRRPYLEIKIEHTGGRWAAWFNGQLVGQFSDQAPTSAPELRLFADGGRARVDSVIFVPLGPK